MLLWGPLSRYLIHKPDKPLLDVDRDAQSHRCKQPRIWVLHRCFQSLCVSVNYDSPWDALHRLYKWWNIETHSQQLLRNKMKTWSPLRHFSPPPWNCADEINPFNFQIPILFSNQDIQHIVFDSAAIWTLQLNWRRFIANRGNVASADEGVIEEWWKMSMLWQVRLVDRRLLLRPTPYSRQWFTRLWSSNRSLSHVLCSVRFRDWLSLTPCPPF